MMMMIIIIIIIITITIIIIIILKKVYSVIPQAMLRHDIFFFLEFTDLHRHSGKRSVSVGNAHENKLHTVDQTFIAEFE